MIRRLLIANRGEIAVRVARTAHRLGIETVGVYSDTDADALHAEVVDVAIALGGSSPAESYLRADAIIAAALDTGADAVHPGYGFLAENADFARAVGEAGLVWVGPTPAQIDLLGDKVAAKRAAADAGVPTTSVLEIEAGEVPEDVPRPALVKAAAGGGGRGMRIVQAEDDLAEALASASREAAAAFGDGRVFIEPFIERGRHVEVQIFGDRHGNVVHLGERECSIQRRNQKVVEEAPSAGIDDATRQTLCDGAVALARHVGYEGAGTVEFLVGADGTITFLEVNTRLQVEHPVTEAVTGLDLVEWQLRVADGDALPRTQEQIAVDGHAIEVRVVAEDPAAGWLPATGRPREVDLDGDGIRVDSGVRAGVAVSADYDSLLAKVIAHAPNRADAARMLQRHLRGARISGVRTNLECLAAVMGSDAFLAADTPTSFLAEHPEVEAARFPAGDERDAHLLAAVLAEERGASHPWSFAPSGWRNLPTTGQRSRWIDEATGTERQVELVPPASGVGPDVRRVLVGAWPEPGDDGALGPDERVEHRVRTIGDDDEGLEIDGRRRTHRVTVAGDVVSVSGPDGHTTWRRVPRFVAPDAAAATAGPVSPLPGSVLSVHAVAGDVVAAGALLVVVEAMKMEHKITAPADATVTAVLVAAGDRVDAGDLLVELGPVEADDEDET